jgi:hypothetical protein
MGQINAYKISGGNRKRERLFGGARRENPNFKKWYRDVVCVIVVRDRIKLQAPVKMIIISFHNIRAIS